MKNIVILIAIAAAISSCKKSNDAMPKPSFDATYNNVWVTVAGPEVESDRIMRIVVTGSAVTGQYIKGTDTLFINATKTAEGAASIQTVDGKSTTGTVTYYPDSAFFGYRNYNNIQITMRCYK